MNDSDKLIARGHVTSLDLSYNDSARVIIAIGKLAAIAETPIDGTIYIDGQPTDEWQLGQMVTITIER